MEVQTDIHQAKPCVKCGSIEERDKRGVCKACKRAYHEAHREEELVRMKAYDKAHREKKVAYDAAYREAHREELAAKQRAYGEAHRKERAARERARKASDSLYRLKCYIRIKTAMVLRVGGYSKRSSTAVILGCTFEEFKVHLEKQFWPGMSWENTGEWHLDHIIPLASAKTEGETLRLCHFSNLQPLWGDDNLSKNDRLDWTPAESQHPLHENDY